MSPGQARPRDPLRIVIADDDRLFAHMVRARVCEQPDLEVVGLAVNGEEAVELAEQLEPDIVVMDVSMPVLDGIDATRIIRDRPDPPAVVLITGEDGATNSRAYEVGAVAYLRKSVDMVALVEVIVTLSQLVGAGS